MMNYQREPNTGTGTVLGIGKFGMMRKKDLIFIGLLAIVLLGIYGKTLNSDLIWDDRLFFKDNILLDENLPPWDAFEYGYFGDQLGVKGFDQYYRPLLTATFMLEKKLWGIQNTTLRLTNLIIFILAVFTLFALLKQHSDRLYFAEIAAVLFALHPLHMDNIVWIVGRGDLMLLLFAALMFLCLEVYIQKKKKGFLVLSSFLFGLGIFSKESFLFFLPLLIVFEVVRRKKITIPYHLVNGAIILLFYYVKLAVLEIGNIKFAPPSNIIANLKAIIAVLGYYIKSIVSPLSYKMFISRDDVLSTSYLILGILAVLLFILLIYATKKHRQLLFPVLLSGSFLLGHVALIFTPIFPYQIYSRYAMVAILGFSWIGAYFLCRLKEKYRLYPVLLIAVVFIPSIILNSAAYKTELKFWQKAARSSPNDTFVQYEIAQALFERNAFLESEVRLNNCLSLRMKRRTAAFVSLLYADLGYRRADYESTLRWLANLDGFLYIPNFNMAPKLLLDINHKTALVDMARGSVGSAEKLFRENIALYPGYSQSYTELFRLYIGYNFWEKAEDFEQEIRRRFPSFFSNNPSADMIKKKFLSLSREQKIYFLYRYSNYSSAIDLVQKKPDLEIGEKFFLAKLYYLKGDEKQAKLAIEKIQKEFAGDTSVLNQIGEFYLKELIRAEDAVVYFEESLAIDGNQTSIRDLVHSLKENYLNRLNPVWDRK